jgi:hypothetical protein
MGWNALLLVLAATAVTVGCLVPNRWLPPLPNDKLLHFVSFAVLTGLALPFAHDAGSTLWWLFGLLAAGWLIECLQSLLPDRNFCWRDLAANAGGIVFAALATWLIAPTF